MRKKLKRIPVGLSKDVHWYVGRASLTTVLLRGACISDICDASSGGPCKTCIFGEAAAEEEMYTEAQKTAALMYVLDL